MATQLTIVNDVLRRLREKQVSSVASSDYSALIGSFVNDAKEDLEDMWFWTVNETSYDTTITSDGTTSYDLSSTTDRSFLIRYIQDDIPMAYDVTTNENTQLYDVPLKYTHQFQDTFVGTAQTLDRPIYFSIAPAADGRGYGLELMQGASSTRTWRTYWYTPQAGLALDGTDDDTSILLPERPIFLRTLFYAMNERGEEMGEPGSILDRKAADSAAAAMELDMQVNKKSEEKTLTNLEALRNDIMSGW